MKDNYLWDRSGEPDPDVQSLEEILGTLRYQPRPLLIPNDFKLKRRWSSFPLSAIAAALVLGAILIAAWFHFARTRVQPALQVRQDSVIERPTTAPGLQASPENHPTILTPPKQANQRPRRESQRNLLARNTRRPSGQGNEQAALTPEEQSEKEKVLIALRLVSAKLSFAQRRTQGVPETNTIRNQHKIG